VPAIITATTNATVTNKVMRRLWRYLLLHTLNNEDSVQPLKRHVTYPGG
jgi:hypothetical protein